jgi:hypothetical protein
VANIPNSLSQVILFLAEYLALYKNGPSAHPINLTQCDCPFATCQQATVFSKEPVNRGRP